MLKVCLLIAVAIASVSAQSGAEGGEARAEPYSYGYETESHAASEQRDPSGKVTGYYTIVDADGRQRRVEYFADESGFHAKVQTNEVGTKSDNSADVEIVASPPTQEQFVFQSPPVSTQQTVTQTVQQQPQRFVSQQQQIQRSGYAYGQQQPYGYSYNPGYGYGVSNQRYGYGVVNPGAYGVSNQQYGYGVANPGVYRTTTTQYGAGNPVVYGAGNQQSGYYSGQTGNFNNHLPASYYRSVSSVQQQPATVSRYVSSVGGVSPVSSTGTYRSSSYQSSVGPAQVGVVPARSGYSSSGSSSSSNLSGSSNYIVLKKRSSEAVAQAN